MYWIAGALGALLVAGPVTLQAADAKPAAPSPAKKDAPATEGEFAQWLVGTLGLTRSLPASPSAQECFAVLLQNGITPKLGWNPTNTVTMGNLARIVVQSMRRQGEVQNPDLDASWIDFLAKAGINIRSITQALEILGPVDPAYVAQAAVVSTDPLRKQAHTRPPDENQFGTDLQPMTLPQILEVYGLIPGAEEPVPPTPPTPPKPPRPSPRPPMTRT